MSTAWEQLHARIISCTACPRLVEYRVRIAATRKREFASWTYWGRPVPGFGDRQARVLVVGLAPAAHGANRTGRMFTGDASADFLMAALYRAGFANQPFSHHAGDGLELSDVFLTAPVRCAPPGNRPLPEELRRCFPFLQQEFALLRPRVKVVVALGRFAFHACRQLLGPLLPPAEGERLRQVPFAHGAVVRLSPPAPSLVLSYHPSRQNTQTGRLTAAMMDKVFSAVRQLLETPDVAHSPNGSPSDPPGARDGAHSSS